MEHFSSGSSYFPPNTSHISMVALVVVSCAVLGIIGVLLFLCAMRLLKARRRNDADTVCMFDSDSASEDENSGERRRDNENETYEMQVFNRQGPALNETEDSSH